MTNRARENIRGAYSIPNVGGQKSQRQREREKKNKPKQCRQRLLESFDLSVLNSVNGFAAMWFYISSLSLCIFFSPVLKLPFQPFCSLQTLSTPTGIFLFFSLTSLLMGWRDTLLREVKCFFHD